MLSQKWVFLDKISGQIIRLNSLKNVFLVRTNLLQFSVFGREYVEGVRIPPPCIIKGGRECSQRYAHMPLLKPSLLSDIYSRVIFIIFQHPGPRYLDTFGLGRGGLVERSFHLNAPKTAQKTSFLKVLAKFLKYSCE